MRSNGSAARSNRSRRFFSLVAWVLIVFAMAAFGAQFSPGAWYTGLAKPAWTPPSVVFGPVWTMLYLMMAVAAWLVWGARRSSPIKAALAFPAIGVFMIQLVLNALWSWLFFGLQRPDLALVDIILMLATIIVTLLLFRRVHRAAGLLLVPYLAWVTFATALNWKILSMN